MEILAVQLGKDGRFDLDDRLPDPEDIKIICSNLIICSDSITSNREPGAALDNRDGASKDLGQAEIVDDDNQEFIGSIRLSHFSVKEYLLSDRCFVESSFSGSNCHALIAEVCLTYMKHLFDIGSLDHEIIKLYPLTSYATKYWFKHLQLLDTIPDRILNMALEVLTDPIYSLAFSRIVGLDFWICRRVSSDFSIGSSDLTPPLAQIAATGIPELLAKILKNDIFQPFQPTSLNSALVLAALSGSEANVQTLLSIGADIDGQGYNGLTALAAAATHSDARLVQLLLKAGANVNIRAHDPWHDALSLAIPNRHIVQLLLDAGADFNARYRALSTAIWQPLILRMIIRGGVDAETGYDSSTPLQSVTNSRRATSMRMLIEAGADISAISANDQEKFPLRNAVESGELEYVQFLLDASDRRYDLISPGHPSLFMDVAAHKGHQHIVSLLLAHGADIDGGYGDYGSSLQAAAASNQEPVVQLLLEAGAEVNVKPGRFGSALQAAVVETDPIVETIDISQKYAKKGQVSLIEMTLCLRFLQVGIRLPMRGMMEGTVINVFSSSLPEPHKDIVQVEILTLLQQYQKSRLLQNEEISPQQYISNLKQDLLAHLGDRTLKHFMNSNTVGISTSRSLDESESLLLLLCDLGAAMDHSTISATMDLPLSGGWTPASYSLVERLLDRGADVNMDGGPYGTALQAASRHGNRDIVNLLL